MAHPDIVLLSKSKKSNDNNVCDFLDTIDHPEIPQRFLHGIYITMQNGEKFKINNDAIKEKVVLKNIVDQLVSIGVPNEMSLIELILDTDKAARVISKRSNDLLEQIFAE